MYTYERIIAVSENIHTIMKSVHAEQVESGGGLLLLLVPGFVLHVP